MRGKVLWLLVLLGSASSLSAKDLWLKAKTQVPDGFVRLAQLVEDSNEAAPYESVFLGKAPTEKPEQLTLEYIKNRLQKQGFISVEPKLRNNALSLEISPLKVQEGVSLPPLKIATQVPLTPSQAKSTERREYSYLGLKEAQSRGTLLLPEMVESVKDNRLIEDAFVVPEDLIGYRLERSLSKGSILTQRLVSVPPTIEKGATIKLIMRSPGIEISGIGKTLSEGKVGDTIEVRRQNETLKGTIIDPHTVLIQ